MTIGSTAPDRSQARQGSIHVCPLSALPDVVAGCGASHLITCLQDEIVVETPSRIQADLHMRLHVHDIAEPVTGYVAPAEEHIARLIEFAHAWNGKGPMVIHCWAGISRSTAAAFVSLCALNPDASELAIARRLRDASPTAQPNRLMIRLADAALTRSGRMVAAVEAIGRAASAYEARPFSLPADMSDVRRAWPPHLNSDLAAIAAAEKCHHRPLALALTL